VELFYRNQGNEDSGYVTDEFLTAIAKKAGVKDIAAWNRARRSSKLTEQVEATTAEAEDRYGYHGTPSFLIQGPKSNGIEPLGTPGSTSAFEDAIAAAR
jgi:2-hydroxychromene-2-carboxylate isomerase